MRKLLLVIMIVSLIAIVGCAKRTVVAPDSDSQQSSKDATKDGQDGSKDGQSTMSDGDVAATDISMAMKDMNFPSIHFDFDKYDIKPKYRAALMEVSNWLISNEAVLLIEGHCDERGTNEYNLALGDRRAKATLDFLMASGVPSRKLKAVSYGEEQPICTDQNEDCWAQNRRAQFGIGSK